MPGSTWMLAAREGERRDDAGIRRAPGDHDVGAGGESRLDLLGTCQRHDIAHGTERLCRNGWRRAQRADAALAQGLGDPACGLVGIKPCHLDVLPQVGRDLLGDGEHPIDGRIGAAGARRADDQRHTSCCARNHQLAPLRFGGGSRILRCARAQRIGAAVGRSAVDANDVGPGGDASRKGRVIETHA